MKANTTKGEDSQRKIHPTVSSRPGPFLPNEVIGCLTNPQTAVALSFRFAFHQFFYFLFFTPLLFVLGLENPAAHHTYLHRILRAGRSLDRLAHAETHADMPDQPCRPANHPFLYYDLPTNQQTDARHIFFFSLSSPLSQPL